MSLTDNNFLFRFFWFVNVLGVSKETTVIIGPSVVRYQVDGNVWDVCYAYIYAQATIFVSWSDQEWTVGGEFGFGTQSFLMRMTEALTKAADNFGKQANRRLTKAQETISAGQSALQRAQQWFDEKKSEVDEANVAFDNAVLKLRKAQRNLEDARDRVESVRDSVRDKINKVDNICTIKSCRRSCLPGLKAGKCRGAWGITLPCLKTDKCAIQIYDPICVLGNAGCHVIRGLAFVGLKIADGTLGVALRALDAAKFVVQTAEIVVDESRIVLDVAKAGLDILKASVSAADFLLEGAKVAIELVKDAVKVGVEVFNFIIEFGLGSIVDLKRASFEITVSTADVFVFKVKIEVDLFRQGMQEVEVVIDFKNLSESISNAALRIVKLLGELLLPHRRRRSLDNFGSHDSVAANVTTAESEFMRDNDMLYVSETDENKLRLAMFAKKCSRFTELIGFLIEAVDVLHEVSMLSEYDRGNASLTLTETDVMLGDMSGASMTMSDLNMTTASFGYNMTEATLNSNMTEEEIMSHLRDMNMLENPVINESMKALEMLKDTGMAGMSMSSQYQILGPWKSAVENVTRETFETDQCASFEDCVAYTFHELADMYGAVELPEAETMRSLLTSAEDHFNSLLMNNTLRLDDAVEVSQTVKSALEETVELKVFCASLPEIWQHPLNQSVLSGQTLTLHCNASGDPEPRYYWYKDGNILPNLDINDLTIDDVNRDDTGRYQCAAKNHISTILSDEALFMYLNILLPPCIHRKTLFFKAWNLILSLYVMLVVTQNQWWCGISLLTLAPLRKSSQMEQGH
ncbi:uncharacterized protein [Ptychodera flava]|uniref:uncharacterized protein isoform X1 n=1 Tax=Ptychodera flava TaxID=63121 RepID=UPI003969E4C5